MTDQELLRQAWSKCLGSWRKVAKAVDITPQHMSRIRTGKASMSGKVRWQLNKLVFGYNVTQTDGGESFVTVTTQS